VTLRSRIYIAVVVGFFLAAATTRIAVAQHITVDGRFSPARPLAGPNYAISATLGKQVGSNLFHSFGQFGLSTGESATFTSSGSTGPISNVIGRVTGGSQSSINGDIQSNIAGANLYLINPSGIVFGPNATVNVSGSFRASTADYIKMADGARFQATNPDGSTLSAAPPAAFGFLNATPGKITVNGSALSVDPGQTLGLIGGPVSINNAQLSAPGGLAQASATGTIRVTSVAGSGEVPAAKGTGRKPTVTGYGPVQISNFAVLGGQIAAPSMASDQTIIANGNNVIIRAGQLSIANSFIATGTNSEHPENSGSVSINVTDQLSIDGGGISSSNTAQGTLGPGPIIVNPGTGTPGNITVKAGTLSISNGGVISGSTFGASGGGNVAVTVSGALTVAAGGQISSATFGTGNAGAVAISAGNLSMTDNSVISTRSFGPGNPGSVHINVGTLDLQNSSRISSTTDGSGTGGDVTVDATSASIRDLSQISVGTGGPGKTGNAAVSVSGNLSIFGPPSNDTFSSVNNFTGIGSVANPGSTGNAGNVAVNAGSLSIGGFLGEISSSTLGPGAGGDVLVNVAGPLSITGPRGNFPTGIVAAAFQGGTGNGGRLVVSSGSLSIVNGGEIAATSAGTGAGGSVNVMTHGSLLLDGMGTSGTQIAASATGTQSGLGGSVMVEAGDLTVRGGAQIASTTAGLGNGGSVQVTAHGPATLSDTLSGIVALASSTASGNAGSVMVGAPQITVASGATIATATAGTGMGGSVAVTTPGALLLDGMGVSGTQIAASAMGPQSGPGGSVTVDAGTLTAQGGAQIASTTAGPGKGGPVQVTVHGPLTLRDPGSGINASTISSGNAGSVTVTAPQITIASGGTIASATAGTGMGGSVAVTTPGALLLDGMGVAGTQIAASADQGSLGGAGEVTVFAGNLTAQGGAQIASSTAGPGKGGSVNVAVSNGVTLSGAGLAETSGITTAAQPGSSGDAGQVVLKAGGAIALTGGAGVASSTAGAGKGGTVQVVAQALTLSDPGSGISASALGTGNAGNVALSFGSLSISHGGAIATDTNGPGNGGNVSVNVDGPLAIDGAGETGLTGISSRSRAGTGTGGNVSVRSDSLSVRNEGMISSGTLGPGNGGSVLVDTAGQLLIHSGGQITATSGGGLGSGGDVVVKSAELSIMDGGTISSETLGPGGGGNVFVTVPGEILVDGNQGATSTGILATATPGSAGTGGNVTLNSGALTLRDGGVISTERFGSGHTGSISLDVAQGLLIDGSSGIGTPGISAKSEPGSAGSAGNVTVQAGALSISGVGQISASTQGSGIGGNITVMVEGTAALNGGGQITAESTGSGDAGSIRVSAVRMLLSNRATISTEAEKATASGGNITLKVRDLLYLIRSDITTSVQGETGNGGNVEIDPQLVILNHSSIKAQAQEGHGGNIAINAGTFIPSVDSRVDASSELGISGTVEITGPWVDVNGALVVLSSELRSAVEVLRHTCAAQATEPHSSLVEAGRGGLLQDPEATLPALYIAGRDVNLTSSRAPEMTEPIRPAQTTAQLIMRCS
jgi:filamentous hemagglutinin family protein